MEKGYYIPVLGYHQLSDDEWYYNDANQFERHMKWLHENNYTPITLTQFNNYYTKVIDREQLPHKPLLIMFDDARQGVYEHAFPVLKKYNFPFSIYTIGSSTENVMLEGGFDDYFMSWENIQEMVKSGLVEIGSHSHDSHQFVFEGFNADGSAKSWGKLATHIWKDNGIYPAENYTLGKDYPITSYMAFPICGTSYNADTDELYKIDTYLGFYATKTMEVDRIVLHCPTHIPIETCYDVDVEVSMGVKTGAHSMSGAQVVVDKWRPYTEPVDLVDDSFGMTWVNGRYDVINFKNKYTVQAGQWYNIRLRTLNLSDTRQEMRIFVNPSLPYDNKNCSTNSTGSDYNKYLPMTDHHCLPDIIISDGSGRNETSEEYSARVREDLLKSRREIEEYSGSCVTKVPHYVRQDGRNSTNFPLFGAGDNYGTFERCNTFLKMKWDTSFSSNTLGFESDGMVGQYYTAIFDIYFGEWNDSLDVNRLAPVREGYFLTDKPDNYKNFEIVLNRTIHIEAGKEYCLAFKTLNQDAYLENGTVVNYEGVFTCTCTANPVNDISSPSVTAYYNNTMTGQYWNYDYNKNLVCAEIYPTINFIEEKSTYPVGKYEPNTWAIAFPFGAYQDELNKICRDLDFELQFTVYSGFLETSEYRNGAFVDDLAQIPRIMMKNDSYMSPYPKLIMGHTSELFRNKFPYTDVKKYAYVINRPWGCYSLRDNWQDIDCAIFDCYNYDLNLNLHGEPNIDWEWFKSKGKQVMPMFGNWGTDSFDPAIAQAIFDNPDLSIKNLLDTLKLHGWHGCAIDFEEVPPAMREKATNWFRRLCAELHKEDAYYEVFVAAPYPFSGYSETPTTDWDAWFDYVEVAKVVDKLSPMTYLDSGSWTAPGPISDYQWMIKRYDYLINELNIHPGKLTGGIGAFGCKWIEGQEPAEQNMIELCSLFDGNVEPVLDYDKQEWHVKLNGELKGDIWFQSPSTMATRIDYFKSKGINSIAIWKLDDDDYSWWTPQYGTSKFRPKHPTNELD